MFNPRLNQWMTLLDAEHLENDGVSSGIRAPWRLALGDVNGDGRADLLAGGSFGARSTEPHIVALDLSDRTVLFETDYLPEDRGDFRVLAIAGADLDRDGRAEIIVGTEASFRYTDGLSVYAQSGPDGEFVRTEHDIGLDQISDIMVRDFDGNGELEVVVFGRGWPYTFVRLNTEFEELDRFNLGVAPSEGPVRFQARFSP